MKFNLNVALHGIDSRNTKTITMFLKNPCKGAATIVDDPNIADIDIFDSDIPASKVLLEIHLQKKLKRPVIVLSLHGFQNENIFNLKKPVNVDNMLQVLTQAKSLIKYPLPNAMPLIQHVITETTQEKNDDSIVPFAERDIEELWDQMDGLLSCNPEKPESCQDGFVTTNKQESIPKLDGKNDKLLFNVAEGININDPEQFSKAHYNPANYYQGTVQTAIAISRKKCQPYMLHSNWNRIILLPQTGEVWHDGYEEDIKVFSGIQLKQNKSKRPDLHLTPIKQEVAKLEAAKEKGNFQAMETFLWKLACWTSMGRYPQSIDYTKPITLNNTPDFTRFLATPHAQNISSLLIQKPKTMGDIAVALNIQPQFVFVFVSAANAIGLVTQPKKIPQLLMSSLKRNRA